MKTYTTIEEITKDFIKKGWSNPSFKELAPDNKYFNTFEDKIVQGKKYFVMNATGNIFDSHGKVAMFNIEPTQNPVCIPVLR